MLVVVVVGVATTTLLLALMVALVRQLKVLAAALKRFRDETQPGMEALRSQQAGAESRARGLSRRGEPERPRPGARSVGDRIRR